MKGRGLHEGSMPGPGCMEEGERQGRESGTWRDMRTWEIRNRETRLTSLLGVSAGADFIAGKSDWWVVGEVTRRNSKAGQKVSKATDFLHTVQFSKTSIVVYFQARDPDCRLHLTHTVVNVSTYQLGVSVWVIQKCTHSGLCKDLFFSQTRALLCCLKWLDGVKANVVAILRLWDGNFASKEQLSHCAQRQEAGDMDRMGSLLDLPLTGEEKPSLEGPDRLLTFLLIYSTFLPLN